MQPIEIAVIVLTVLAVVGLGIGYLVKRLKGNGGSSCGCSGCSGCSHCSQCAEDAKKLEEIRAKKAAKNNEQN